MIPFKLHYIWLSNEPLNTTAKFCIQTWKECANHYQLKRWSMEDFDFTEMPDWVIEAVQKKKWAFACDYLRLYVLFHEGGFYLDSDVAMIDPPDRFCNHRFVSAVEYFPDLFETTGKKEVDENGCSDAAEVPGMAIQAAIMGSEPGHPYVKKCMEFYENNHFIQPDGGIHDQVLAPQIYANVAREIGFRYTNVYQKLENDTVLYPSEIFAPGYNESTADSTMIHLCNGSWRDMNDIERKKLSWHKGVQQLKIRLKKNRR